LFDSGKKSKKHFFYIDRHFRALSPGKLNYRMYMFECASDISSINDSPLHDCSWTRLKDLPDSSARSINRKCIIVKQA